MNTVISILFILFFAIAPFGLRKIGNKIQFTALLSDVVICFVVGIFFGNTKQWWLPAVSYQGLSLSIAETCIAASVLIAIPMLLMISNLGDFLRYAPKLLLSFGLCIVAVLISTVIVAFYFKELEHLGKALGCMVGVYIGGTPNMVAISYAVKAPPELFVILNSTDLFSSGLYFLFLTSLAKPFFGLFLQPFVSNKNKVSTDNVQENVLHPIEEALPIQELDETKFPPLPLTIITVAPLAKALFLSFFCIGISVGVAFLFPNPAGNLNELLLMIVLSTTSVAFSFYKPIRTLKGVYEFAQYLLLIFALAVGFMADFSTLAAVGTSYLVFNAAFVFLLIVIHLFLAIIFKIDTDSFIVTSAACVFGPPFIGQICSAIKNKEMLAPGMALGVLGLVVGTYLGILVTSLIG